MTFLYLKMQNTTGMPQASSIASQSAVLGSVLGSLVIAAVLAAAVVTVATVAVFCVKRKGKGQEGYARNGMKHKLRECSFSFTGTFTQSKIAGYT